MNNTTWKTFAKEGDAFLKTARGGTLRPSVFNPEILYNLLAMAIEKHIMAALIFKGTLADNHTFSDLIDSADSVCRLPESVVNEMKILEQYQEICPVFEGYNRPGFPVDAVPGMIRVAEQVQTWMRELVEIENIEVALN